MEHLNLRARTILRSVTSTVEPRGRFDGISGFAEPNFPARKRYGFWWPAFAALAPVQVAAQFFRSMFVALLRFALDDWWVVSAERKVLPSSGARKRVAGGAGVEVSTDRRSSV